MFSTTHKHLELLSVEKDSTKISKKEKKNSNSTYSSPLFSGPQISQRQFGH